MVNHVHSSRHRLADLDLSCLHMGPLVGPCDSANHICSTCNATLAQVPSLTSKELAACERLRRFEPSLCTDHLLRSRGVKECAPVCLLGIVGRLQTNDATTIIEQRIDNTKPSRRLSAVGSACKTEVGIYFAIAAMTSGSSADTTWTFSGEMAAPAVGESTADDMVVQSVDSSTEDDKAKPSAVAKVVPKAKTSSRASTPSRPTSAGSKTTKASDRRSERPMLPVIQSLRWLSKGKDKGSRTPEQFPKPSSSRSSLTRSRTSTKVKKKSMVVAGRRTPPLEANSEEMVVEATPAMEDTSPIGFHSPGEDQDDQPLDTLRNQLEAARFAQQMFHQSEIQKYEGIVQTLVDKINEMSQEDEGSGLRIQELERQRDTACLAMQHMNQVKQKMMKDYEEAMTRMDEQSHAQRHHDQSIAEELAQQLQRLRS